MLPWINNFKQVINVVISQHLKQKETVYFPTHNFINDNHNTANLELDVKKYALRESCLEYAHLEKP